MKAGLGTGPGVSGRGGCRSLSPQDAAGAERSWRAAPPAPPAGLRPRAALRHRPRPRERGAGRFALGGLTAAALGALPRPD